MMLSLDLGPNKEEKLEKLASDYDKPFCPPIGVKEYIPSDYPSLDTGIDAHEWYDEGRSGAAEADFLRNKVVISYHKPVIIRRLSAV